MSRATDRMPPVVVITGPTASGKSGLAMAVAEQLPIEIITMDSAQVFRGMDIGTAKPSVAEQAAVPHHLLDIRDPAEAYSAAQFCSDAMRLIGEIRARDRRPVLVGGTNLYLRALEHGLNDLPPADADLREKFAAKAKEQGWPAMHEWLERLDPERARCLHPNDQQRIQRALEIALMGGAPASDRYRERRGGAFQEPLIKLAVCSPDRQILRQRIAARFESMMEQGLLEEVQGLYRRGELSLDLPSIRCVGYRQLWMHLDGAFDLDQAVQRAIIATCQFSKRQMTWLRKETELSWLDSDQPDILADALHLIGA